MRLCCKLVDAYAMLANKGVKMPLSLYKLDAPPRGEQMIDRKNCGSSFVDDGNGNLTGWYRDSCNHSGLSCGGKTGTAHKLRADRKGYSTNEYRALFAGVAPVSDPRLAMVVVVENPQGTYYGGTVSAPVFARVMQESLRLMNVPLDKPLDAPVIKR